MSIIIANDGDVVVDDIASRDAISKKIPGMSVTVNDATGDISLGSGWAKYEWDSTNSRWMLISAEMKSDLRFSREKKVLENGTVTANHVPADSLLWDARIIDSATGVILSDVSPTVSGATIDIEDMSMDGHFLEYSYAYGTMSTQLTQLISDFVVSGGGGGSSLEETKQLLSDPFLETSRVVEQVNVPDANGNPTDVNIEQIQEVSFSNANEIQIKLVFNN